MMTDVEPNRLSALLRAQIEHDNALIEALTQACESARDFIRREHGWFPASPWADATLRMLDAVIERAEAQS